MAAQAHRFCGVHGARGRCIVEQTDSGRSGLMQGGDSDWQLCNAVDNEAAAARPGLIPAEREGRMRLSMHDGVPVWCDCCSCEAEPYWLALAEASDSEQAG